MSQKTSRKNPAPKLPVTVKLPARQRDVVALFKGFGPRWMMAALVVTTLGGVLGSGFAVLMLLKALH